MIPIREARPGDLPKLRVIQAATLAEPWPALLELGVDGPPILLVATDPDAGPVGYALAVVGKGAHAPEVSRTSDGERHEEPPAEQNSRAAELSAGWEPSDSAAYLVELAVAEPYQGSGRGSALLARLADYLRTDGCDRLRLTVRERDRRARSFYRDRGFERRERLPEHYESGDGLLLVWPLQE